MLSLEEMNIIEENAVELGISRILMMENAGSNVADYLKKLNLINKVAIFAGTGNKAGDGFVAARHIASYGGKVIIILSHKEDEIKTEEAKENFKILKRMKKSVEIFSATNMEDEEIVEKIKDVNVIIDALIGTGIKGKLRPEIARLVKIINQAKIFKLSIDVPTGIDPDTGESASDYVKCDVVITMHKMKKGLSKFLDNIKIIEANIGIPPEAEIYAGIGDAKIIFKKRNPYSRKGDNGVVLIIGGSKIYHGAPTFSALAASRSGIDLVYLAVPEKIANTIRSIAPELIVIPYEEEKLTKNSVYSFKKFIEKSDVIAIGPGLGQDIEEGVEEVFKITKELNKYMVVDADALKTEIAKKPNGINAIYTPHAGEFKILTGKDLPFYDKIEERSNIVKEESKKLGVTILLKGHIDIISDGNKVKLNRTGTQAMTVGGTGDVLTGLCAALLAKSKRLFESAVAAAYINGKAGEMATEDFGNQIVATDLIKYIPKIIKNLDPTYFPKTN
jgi:yjeF C-terminal region, hydroxyethylthiazole kinase-related/yjeF N-terminal region